MDKRIFVSIFILFFFVSACVQAGTTLPAPSPSISPSSGIEGYVTIGPMCPGPVAIGDTRCHDQPYQANISILGADNKEIKQFQTDPIGYFKITLTPGTYILHPKSTKTLPRAGDQTVIIVPDQFTQVTVMYDTGMR